MLWMPPFSPVLTPRSHLDQRESAFENALKANYKNSNPISQSSFTFNQNNGAAGSATVNLPNVFMTLIGSATTEVKVDSKAGEGTTFKIFLPFTPKTETGAT